MPSSRAPFALLLVAVLAGWAPGSAPGPQDAPAAPWYPDYAKAAKRVSVNGTDIAYVEKGRGEPVVLVHGDLGDLRVWGPLVDALAAKYRVLAYSRRGHFPSVWDADGPEYTAEQHVEDLMALLKALKVGRAHLVGHGYGARIATIVASRRPEMVRSLVAAEPTLVSLLEDGPSSDAARLQSAGVVAGVAAGLRGRDAAAACRAFVDAEAGEGTFDALPGERRRQLEDNVSTLLPTLAYYGQGAFGCEDAKRVVCPTLLVHGERSRPRHEAIVAGLAECTPADVVVELPSADHVSLAGNPDAFVRAVAEFLAKS
jgi:pimeloyl-ACP methyl ester carboxylesterase